MSDIKRNDNKNPDDNHHEHEKTVTPVPPKDVKKSSGPLQVHFGNVEALKLKFAEADNRMLSQILYLLRDINEKLGKK